MKSLGMIVQAVVSLLILAGGGFAYYWMGEPEVAKRPPSRAGMTAVKTVTHTDQSFWTGDKNLGIPPLEKPT
jgi:flagellar basal body-associated protein FliL